jgi:hypothetical protein
MKGVRSKYSIFFHSPDRGTFVSYFLGAVVPLIALGIVAERYLLSPIVGPIDSYTETMGDGGILALFAAISLLSLSCFFMLRRLVNDSIEANRALAQYDSLTGLPNRGLYKQRLEQALLHMRCHGGLVATCFLDLDGFKRINDTLGHSSGDRLLCQVAERPGSRVSAATSSRSCSRESRTLKMPGEWPAALYMLSASRSGWIIMRSL